MRYISKPELVPEQIETFSKFEGFKEFLEGAKEHKTNILKSQRDAFYDEKWFQGTQKVLENLYEGKCAFCEQKFSKYEASCKITVKHFRPKNKFLYYWLAVEWTNLIPTCPGCNQPKKSLFPVKQKVKSPFEDDQLNEKLFDAQELNRLEEPLLLHPEIDDPKLFLIYDKNADLQAIDDNERGVKTIELLELNDEKKRENLIFKRRKILDNIRKNLEFQLAKIIEKQKETDTDFLEIAFDRDFEAIMTNAHNLEIEFTSLHNCIYQNFDELIIFPIVKNLTESLDIEIQESVQKDIEKILNNAFQKFLERSLNI